MLILQRKAGESLLIGENIEISVLSVDAGRVRLAIQAPRSIPVLRMELVNAVTANREAAADDGASPLALLNVLQPDGGGTVPNAAPDPEGNGQAIPENRPRQE